MARAIILIVDPGRLFRDGLKQLLRKSGFVVGGEGQDWGEARACVDPGALPDLVLASLATGNELDDSLEQIRRMRTDFPEAKVVALADALGTSQFLRALRAGVHAILTKNISSTMLETALDLVIQGQHLFPAPLPHALLGDADARDPTCPQNGVAQAAGETASADHAAPGHDHIEHRAAPPARLLPFLPSAPSGAAPSLVPALVPALGRPAIGLSEREGQILRCLVGGFSNKAIARELNIAETTVKVHVKGLLRKLHAANRTQAAIWAMNNQITIAAADERDGLVVASLPMTGRASAAVRETEL